MKKILLLSTFFLMFSASAFTQLMVGGDLGYFTAEPKGGSMFKSTFGGDIHALYLTRASIAVGLQISITNRFAFDEGWAQLMLAHGKECTITQNIKYTYSPVAALTLQFIEPSTGIYVGANIGYYKYTKSGSAHVVSTFADTTLSFPGSSVASIGVAPKIGCLIPITGSLTYNICIKTDIILSEKPNLIINANMGLYYTFGGNISGGGVKNDRGDR